MACHRKKLLVVLEKFRAWVRKRLRCEEEVECVFFDDARPRLPLLPDSSRDVAKISAPNPKATKASPFFRLPPEIRLMIYEFAFGDRVVHMDLQPLFACIYPFGTMGSTTVKCLPRSGNRTLPADWDWWSSVCHRSSIEELWMDQCRRSWAGSLLFPGTLPGGWPIGAMGCLLTCRQAYLEAINILYETNTIHTSSNLVMINFPYLVPPGHLSKVTALELCGKLYLLDGPHAMRDDLTAGWPAFETIVELIEANFDSLQSLSLAVQTGNSNTFPGQPRDLSDVDFDRLWKYTDRLARRFGKQLQFFEVIPQASLYSALEDVVRESSEEEEGRKEMVLRSGHIWRTVPNDDPGADELGYWVKLGTSDYIALGQMTLGVSPQNLR
ncbi:hypothetical protein LOZ10_001475 [Ophidiomyces ophidiicola]|nr:hypothetical protein LOZ10_001475 [Ophidiomyces ophidiicola]